MSKISEATTKHSSTKSERQRCRLQAAFDDLMDRSTTAENWVDWENIYSASNERKRWKSFLDIGCDIQDVMRIMSPMTIWDNFDTLNQKYKANIDINYLMFRFHTDPTATEIDKEEFIRRRADKLVERGANPDLLAKNYFSVESFNHTRRLLNLGASAKTVFELSKDWMEIRSERADEIREILLVFHDYGLSNDDIVGWVRKYRSDTVLDDIVQYHPELWSSMGINIDDYVDAWIEMSADYYLEGHLSLDELPKTVSRERFLSKISEDYGLEDEYD